MKTFYVEKLKEPMKRTQPRMRKTFQMYSKSCILRDKETHEIVAVFLKKAIPKEYIRIGRQMIRFKRKTVRKTISDSSDPIWTTLVGRSFPKYIPPGYLSPATKYDLKLFHGDAKKLMLFFEIFMKKYVPEDYKDMVQLSKKIPKSHKIGKAWHTFQINYDYHSKYHKDSSDTSQYSIVAPFYDFEGAEIVLPAYRCVFPAKEGDLVLMNQHEMHGNLPLRKGHRLSVIPYTHSGFKHYRKEVVPHHNV